MSGNRRENLSLKYPVLPLLTLVRAEKIAVALVIALHRRALPAVSYRATRDLTLPLTGNFPGPCTLAVLTRGLPRLSLSVAGEFARAPG